MQTILGANGTIGRPLAKELLNYTDKVRLVSRNPKKINETDELFPADLSDPSQIDAAVAGSEVVYVLVGFEYSAKIWEEKWPRLMKAVIDSCERHNARLVFFDNMYAYDAASLGNMTEDAPLSPPSRKGAVRKQLIEMITMAISQGRIKALIARAADFYGPDNERSFLIEVTVKNFLKGKKANWLCNPDKKHSFTYTPDAAKATALLGNTDDAYNQAWHLPTNPDALTGREMIRLIAKEMHAKDDIMVVGRFLTGLLGLFMPVMKETKEMLYQYEEDYIFRSDKFEKRFGIKPTSYEEGVRETVKSFLQL
ncbi:MAG: hypothetical protein FMNOHCHN_02633 [Ignavibacteriaceae bacterium]|nr:hypothetical protein [Ignavibacteriaceae bacterium]